MAYFWTGTIVALVVIISIPFYRVVFGPTIFDRLLAISAIGAKTIGLVCAFGFLYDRFDMFVDIALAYAILNFVGTLAVAKYFAGKRLETK